MLPFAFLVLLQGCDILKLFPCLKFPSFLPISLWVFVLILVQLEKLDNSIHNTKLMSVILLRKVYISGFFDLANTNEYLC